MALSFLEDGDIDTGFTLAVIRPGEIMRTVRFEMQLDGNEDGSEHEDEDGHEDNEEPKDWHITYDEDGRGGTFACPMCNIELEFECGTSTDCENCHRSYIID